MIGSNLLVSGVGALTDFLLSIGFPGSVMKVGAAMFFIPASAEITESWSVAGSETKAVGAYTENLLNKKTGTLSAALWSTYQIAASTLTVNFTYRKTPPPSGSFVGAQFLLLYEEFLIALEGIKTLSVLQNDPGYPPELRVCSYLSAKTTMPLATMQSFGYNTTVEIKNGVDYTAVSVSIVLNMIDPANGKAGNPRATADKADKTLAMLKEL